MSPGRRPASPTWIGLSATRLNTWASSRTVVPRPSQVDGGRGTGQRIEPAQRGQVSLGQVPDMGRIRTSLSSSRSDAAAE